MHNYSISCLNINCLFPFFPQSVGDLHQTGKQFCLIFFNKWFWFGINRFSLLLMTLELSLTTLVYFCFHTFLCYGLSLISSPFLALGLAMMDFLFLSCYFGKRTKTIVHCKNLLPLLLMNRSCGIGLAKLGLV